MFLLFLRRFNNQKTIKMKNNILSFLLIIVVFFTSYSQNKKDVLLTINNQPVYNSEFVEVFNKNLDLVVDDSQKSVDGYLDLFIDYKLKIAEAYAQGLDKNEDYVKEFTKYQDQLSKKYIYDKRVTSELVKEAYERGLEEINADHILVQVSQNALPKDTLNAYNKAKDIHDKAVNGEDFVELAKKYSEEPGVKNTGGKLGYFSVFQMVYPFETAAYNTKVGEISKITRTAFGYHIIKVNDRRIKKPKINVSHIMIFTNKNQKVENPKERIDELYAMIMQGKPFEEVAKEFSEDKGTAVKGGEIKTFGPGNLKAPLFEEAAYALENEGDISEPIKSSFGWHIIRLNKKYTIPTFEEQKDEIEEKVTSGARANIITQSVNDKVKKKYGYKEGHSYSPYFETYLTDSILKKKWEITPIPSNEDKILFTIGNKNVKYSDFAEYIYERQKLSKRYSLMERLLKDYFEEFKNKTIIDFYKVKLEEENKEYASIINEYRNGLLVFDVMDKNIWKVAKEDSIGLQKYYEQNKNNYIWKKRVDVDVFSATNEDFAKQVQKLLNEGVEPSKIKEQLNKDGKVNVIITSGLYEMDSSELPDGFVPNVGISKIYKRDSSNIIVNVKKVLEPSVKAFEEVKGMVLSDYQTYVENQWMQSLHEKYKVEINKKSLKKIKKQLDN